MTLVPVPEALDRLLALAPSLPRESVPLRRAAGRALAERVVAPHAVPPFAASAMDGWAVAAAAPGDVLRITGEAAAGHPFTGAVGPGEAVRIFTGAPLPEGAARVVIQEDAASDGNSVTVNAVEDATHVRPAGGDFPAGFALEAGRAIRPRDVALLAAMGASEVRVARRPVCAVLMTGDELRPPGAPLAPGQITASNGYAVAAMLEASGAEARLLPIAPDTEAGLAQAFDLAGGADLVITIGGASVGDHDLVAPAARAAGFALDFHKVAMRPGKPLMAGRRDAAMLVGLPGNPVSAIVCTVVFILPVIRAMTGLSPVITPERHPLAGPLPANGPRAHYMRATLRDGTLHVAERQDSSLLSVLHAATHLVVRAPGAAAAPEGALVQAIPLPG